MRASVSETKPVSLEVTPCGCRRFQSMHLPMGSHISLRMLGQKPLHPLWLYRSLEPCSPVRCPQRWRDYINEIKFKIQSLGNTDLISSVQEPGAMSRYHTACAPGSTPESNPRMMTAGCRLAIYF